jgi:hypothetical protein
MRLKWWIKYELGEPFLYDSLHSHLETCPVCVTMGRLDLNSDCPQIEVGGNYEN